MDEDSLPVTQNVIISQSNKKKTEWLAKVEQDEEEKNEGDREERFGARWGGV